MSYTKKHIYKKQYSTDGGQTWKDVIPSEQTTSGESIGYFDTLEECQTTPVGLKFYGTFIGDPPKSVECNGNPELNSIDVRNGSGMQYLVSAIIGDCVVKIASGCFFGNDGYSTSLTSVTISDSVSIIGSNAFWGCGVLSNLHIGSSVTTIGDSAFVDCESLTNIVLPNSLITIGGSAFVNCRSLSSIDIPSSVTYIGDSAFRNCINFTSITCNAVIPPTLGGNYYSRTFDDTNNCNIYVPNNSVESYKTATFWNKYADRIKPISEKP